MALCEIARFAKMHVFDEIMLNCVLNGFETCLNLFFHTVILAAYTLALCEIARFAKMHVFDEIIACDKRWYKFSSQGNTFVRS